MADGETSKELSRQKKIDSNNFSTHQLIMKDKKDLKQSKQVVWILIQYAGCEVVDQHNNFRFTKGTT